MKPMHFSRMTGFYPNPHRRVEYLHFLFFSLLFENKTVNQFVLEAFRIDKHRIIKTQRLEIGLDFEHLLIQRRRR